MDAGYVTGLAALGGATVGGVTSFITSWTTLRAQTRAQGRSNSKSRRQDLYKIFIVRAAELYADALTHNKLDLTRIVSLYALISRMRVLSSRPVVDQAVEIAKKIVETYKKPNIAPEQVDSLSWDGDADLLKGFSETVRDEFENNWVQSVES
jgi:hypothetical protein